jgi:rhamnosyltransferase subunit B
VRIPKTVLFVWELGGGLGHIQRLLQIAKLLAADGHRVVFALKTKQDAIVITRAMPVVSILQAPVYRRPPQQMPPPTACNYADILHAAGYSDAETLLQLVRAWRQLFDAFKPAVVVCDHSPTAILAGAGVWPLVNVGSGFATPPAGTPFKVLNRATLPGASTRENKVFESIRYVQSRLSKTPSDHVSQIFNSAETFTCSLCELDPYSTVRRGGMVGTAQALPVAQPSTTKPFLFGYLNGQEPRLSHLIQSLVAAKIPSGLYIRQAPPGIERVVAGSAVGIFSDPQKMPDAVVNASAVLHHGGLATTETAMAAGRPQFIYARHLEQGLTAEAVEALGCGVNLVRSGADAGKVIAKSMYRGDYFSKVHAVASRIAGRANASVLDAILQACRKHLV